MSVQDTQSQPAFQKLKPICVPLLGCSSLTPTSVSTVLKLLDDLIRALRDLHSSRVSLNASLISYTFFPISTILKRNASAAIPDQVLEKIFVVLSLLCEDWWWFCELNIWDQIFMLCGSVIGGIEGKGKGKDRDDETKEAAARCLLVLLRSRDNDDGPFTPSQVQSRMGIFKEHAQSNTFRPILGQTLNCILSCTESRRVSLQQISLDLLYVLLHLYFPDDLLVSVLPGVVSSMCKTALGTPGSKGWVMGDTVDKSLFVMQEVVIRSVSDDVCIRDGAVVSVEDLEDLTQLVNERNPKGAPSVEERPFGTIRTQSWLRGSSSQLHIAIKTLSPLVKHPTTSAVLALIRFSTSVLRVTSETLPQTQPLLLSFLLSLSNHEFPNVSTNASDSLLSLLAESSKTSHTLLQSIMRINRDNLLALPMLLPSRADTKVEHVAGLIEATCRLASNDDHTKETSLKSISTEIGKLLGPTGGIEKWGWSLLSVLEFEDPLVTVTHISSAQLMLESDPSGTQWTPFPHPTLKNVSSASTYDALLRMFRSMGSAAGEAALASVEWFLNVAQGSKDSRAVAALWCACRLLEGISNVSLSSDPSFSPTVLQKRKRLEKAARSFAKSIAQLWDDVQEIPDDTPTQEQEQDQDQDNLSHSVEHVQGLVPLSETLKITKSAPAKRRKVSQPVLHKSFSLQLLAITSGILQARYLSLLLYTIYPILHSLVSPLSFLSQSALATLNFITIYTSYATPGNLLLSNFDYVLDSVSRRLSRRLLDVDAAKVLIVMFRLVGTDIVEKAGDVVEECFDRLDEYHGYQVIVEGLVEVLNEVIKVIATEENASSSKNEPRTSQTQRQADNKKFEDFLQWFSTRHNASVEEDTEDYGPAPRRAWGETQTEGKAKAADDERNTEMPPSAEPEEASPTPVQALTKQIVTRSIFFLTHSSPVIRARILTLLSSSVAVLPESSLLPSIHSAWPFILNRLGDNEIFVVSAAAGLIEALTTHFGSYMYRRIWDDVWPRYHSMLSKLEAADSFSALARRGVGAVGTESVYTHSHRLYKSILTSMTAALRGVDPQDSSNWQVLLSFRRFLHLKAAEELQTCARQLYVAAGEKNADAVWLALYSTAGQTAGPCKFLHESKWDIQENVKLIFQLLEG
ncbi:hypothetical protein K435DRAFT_959605 [Dendrothele bispora CBS 962.96]|uniref:Uncharacterized protein n=1 Tax=Dendrothele bispora (strain CBS 962.96) TaxID=1314807 RepID=A0A4V4HIP7_DENBC|nr:hypothetical protein K435DRAFT_959605 [Dendrothele bispora CBS 962.96]